MSERLDALIAGLAASFPRREDFLRARKQWLAGLVQLGRHTVTGLLTTAGEEQQDWSAAYRALRRLPAEKILAYVQQLTLERSEGPWVVAVDDSCTRKSGRRIPGCGWRRDPLSPPFHVNFSWGQRVLQFSAALPATDGSARMVPIDWYQLASPLRPGRQASAQEQEAYLQARREANINRVAAARMQALRQATSRPIHFVVDGRFTNRTVLRNLPEGSVLIGRTRRDTKLYAWCEPLACPGRPRRYGTLLPTPQQWQLDGSMPWQTLRLQVGGSQLQVRVKQIGPVMARLRGIDSPVQLVVIAPVPYAQRRGNLLRRKPAYLLCTDPDLPLSTLVQEYLWRWGIEVNFREEKTLLGVTQAQLRHPESSQRQPAGVVAAYALLLIAASDTYGPHRLPPSLRLPKWRAHRPPKRASTGLLLSQLRIELWSASLAQNNLSDFCLPTNPNLISLKNSFPLSSALLAANY